MRSELRSKNPILITGGSGVIGSSLTRMMGNNGEHVIVYDIRDSKFGHYIEGNILDSEKIKDIITRYHVRGIIHMAGLSHVAMCEQNPNYCWNVNVEGARALTNAASLSKLDPWIINISSREVYGQQNILPVSEDATLNPLNVYGCSKYASEEIFKDLYANSGISVLTLRLSNVYGCSNDISTRVVPAFITAVLEGRPMVLYGGEQILDLIHISDVNNGIARAIHLLDDEPEVGYNVVNIASGMPCKIKDIATIVCNCGNDAPAIRYMPERPFDVCSFIGDTNKAYRLLKFKSRISADIGIPNTFRLYCHSYEKDNICPPIVGGIVQ